MGIRTCLTANTSLSKDMEWEKRNSQGEERKESENGKWKMENKICKRKVYRRIKYPLI